LGSVGENLISSPLRSGRDTALPNSNLPVAVPTLWKPIEKVGGDITLHWVAIAEDSPPRGKSRAGWRVINQASIGTGPLFAII